MDFRRDQWRIQVLGVPGEPRSETWIETSHPGGVSIAHVGVSSTSACARLVELVPGGNARLPPRASPRQKMQGLEVQWRSTSFVGDLQSIAALVAFSPWLISFCTQLAPLESNVSAFQPPAVTLTRA